MKLRSGRQFARDQVGSMILRSGRLTHGISHLPRVKNKTKRSDHVQLNDYCLLEVMDYLDSHDLISIAARVSGQWRRLVSKALESRSSERRLTIVASSLHDGYPVISPCAKPTAGLSCLGSATGRLELNSQYAFDGIYTEEEKEGILKLAEVANQLTSVRILKLELAPPIQAAEALVADIAKTFPNVLATVQHLIIEQKPGFWLKTIWIPIAKLVSGMPNLKRITCSDNMFSSWGLLYCDIAPLAELTDLEVDIVGAYSVYAFGHDFCLKRLSILLSNVVSLRIAPAVSPVFFFDTLLNFRNLKVFEITFDSCCCGPSSDLSSLPNIEVLMLHMVQTSRVDDIVTMIRMAPNVNKLLLDFSSAGHHSRILSVVKNCQEFWLNSSKSLRDLEVRVPTTLPEDIFHKILQVVEYAASDLSSFTYAGAIDSPELQILSRFLVNSKLEKLVLKAEFWPYWIDQDLGNLFKIAVDGKSVKSIVIKLSKQPNITRIRNLSRELSIRPLKKVIVDPRAVSHPCVYLSVSARRSSHSNNNLMQDNDIVSFYVT